MHPSSSSPLSPFDERFRRSPLPMSLRSVECELQLARQRLDGQWVSARPADRLWAVDRLLREGSLAPDRAARLRAVQDVVRDAWAIHRIARAPGYALPLDARVAGLQLVLAERARDAFLVEEDLFDALFLVSEGYIRPAQLPGPPFRDIWRRRQALLAEFSRALQPLPGGQGP